MSGLPLQYLLAGTLRRQLVAGMALVVALMMALFVWDITRRQQAVVLQQQSEQTLALTRSVATASAVGVASRDLSGIQEIVDGFATYPDLRYVIVLDIRGKILAHSERNRLGQYLNDLPQQAMLTVLSQGQPVMDVAGPIMISGQHIGWARVGMGHTSARAMMTSIERSGIFYALLAILLSTLLAWLTGGYLTRRLHAIQQVADSVQAGHTEVRAQVPGEDEAAQLARQFNAMLDTLARREDALAEALNRLQTITNRVPGVVVFQLRLHPDGRMVVPYASEALNDIFHIHPDLVRHDASALKTAVHPEDLPGQLRSLTASAEKLTPWLGELRLVFAGQTETWVQVNAMPQQEPDNGVLWYGFITDITDLKRAQHALRTSEEDLRRAIKQLEVSNTDLKQLNEKLVQSQWQLLQSEKMASIGQLAAGVAHEINNPIGFVQSNLGTLDRYFKDILDLLTMYQQGERFLSELTCGRQDIATWLTHIQQLLEQVEWGYMKQDIPVLLRETRDGVVRVKQIVMNLKEFSHADNQEQWEWADLRKGLDSTLNIAHNEIKYRATVVKEYGDIPPIKCLPSQLNQVFLNLLVNAAQAMAEGVHGKITVRCGATSEGVWVEISDTGPGIAPEHLQHVFEPFFTTKPVGKGTGLGLSLSFGIVQKHGGRIEVHSDVGIGTTFKVVLPKEPPYQAAIS